MSPLGELRPNFIDLCRPDYGRLDDQGTVQFVKVKDVCTTAGKNIKFGMQAFPSGHTMTAFTVGVFVALYLNAKLKAFSDYHTSYWKMVIVITPVLAAGFVAATVMVDHVSLTFICAIHLFRC